MIASCCRAVELLYSPARSKELVCTATRTCAMTAHGIAYFDFSRFPLETEHWVRLLALRDLGRCDLRRSLQSQICFTIQGEHTRYSDHTLHPGMHVGQVIAIDTNVHCCAYIRNCSSIKRVHDHLFMQLLTSHQRSHEIVADMKMRRVSVVCQRLRRTCAGCITLAVPSWALSR